VTRQQDHESAATRGAVTAVTAWETLFRSQVKILSRLQRDFTDGVVTLNEYDLLFNLSEAGGTALLRDLTERLLISQPSVSRLVDRMVERGLLVKQPNEVDRRGVVLEMTEHGRDVYRRVSLRHSQSITDLVGGALNPDELRTLHELTTRLSAAAEAAERDADEDATA